MENKWMGAAAVVLAGCFGGVPQETLERPDEEPADSGEPEDTDIDVAADEGAVVVQTSFGDETRPGMVVSAFRADDEEYLATGWSGEAFAVKSGDIRVYLGDPSVSSQTEDGCWTTLYEGEDYVAAPLDLALMPSSQSEGTLHVNLLIGEQYYTVVEADRFDLYGGREHEEGSYSKGSDWEDGITYWDHWIYQRNGSRLVLELEEGDTLTEIPFGFLNPGEWLEVRGNTIVLLPEDSENRLYDVRVSDDDFAFDYIDRVNDHWWVVTAQAW